MPPTDEDIEWFRSTFHPIPKPRLPDDCVEYSLYIFSSNSRSDDDLRSRLREVQKSAADLQKTYLKDYIWQRQGLSLELTKETGTSLLRGRSEYGDSIEDEWVIVWLLRELTKRIDDLYVKVQDNDGEFLLIEAAATLPEWLEPDVAENRVWIHGGDLLIIKPEHEGRSKQRRICEKLKVEAASDLLVNQSRRIMHSSSIEEEAFYRLRNYPQQIMENIHHTTVTVPRNVAFLLHQKPSYISPTVEAFYLRDPISLKPLQSDASDDLTFPPSDLVTLSISIPRVGYAQLKSQDFPPPRSWAKSFPPKADPKKASQAETGMKIACGMEMLVSDPQQQDKHTVREIKMTLDDIKTGDEVLPTDQEISSWNQREDDEKWLDISFEDLEGELAGGRRKGDDARAFGQFGDHAAQENLQRIVAQFEKFLNDDSAGPDGAGLFNESGSEEDVNEPLNSDDDIDDEGEDKDMSFSDEQLSKMMREMMGMPTSTSQTSLRPHPNGDLSSRKRVEELTSDEEDDEPKVEDIESLSRQMEAELNESGALDLNPTPRKIKATDMRMSKGKSRVDAETEDSEEEDQEENDVDINLARNLLESLKSQGGMAGPGGNLMGLMGMGMPRDEDEDAYRTGSWRGRKQ